jgi:amphiphysin
MSWKGFKKAVARMPQSMGMAQPTSKDDEYEQLSLQVTEIHQLAKSLWDDSKRFKDSLSLMLAHQSEIADAFVDIFHDDEHPEQSNVASKFSQTMKDAKETLSGDLEKIERLVVAPTGNICLICIGDYLTILTEINKCLVKRAHKLLDYDRHRASVEKLKAKPSKTLQDEKTLGQYENNFDNATREFNNINNLLKQDLPIVIATRIEFIDPCLLTYYEYQMKVYHTLYGYFKPDLEYFINVQVNISILVLALQYHMN